MRLSVLDQSIAVAGRPHHESIRNTVALARHCEALGYDRFWVSEHHNHPTIVGTAPEIIMAAIAATTERIRIGSAGIMLPHYSPFKVAEVFRVLDALAPGRIDMGLGRAPGSDGRTAFALNPMANERPEHFPADVRDLMAWVHNEPLVQGHPFAAVKAFPQGETAPEVWILGSSDYGAQVAAHFGLPYCYAWFFSDGAGGERAIEIYKRTYKPSVRNPEPHSALCVSAFAAPTMEEAQYHLTPRLLSRLNRDRGILGPLASPEDAQAALKAYDAARIEKMRQDAFAGTAPEVAERIRELQTRVGVDEMAIVTWTHDEEARRQSYTLLAKV
jgi:luciferase family oxidoreductase group 1